VTKPIIETNTKAAQDATRSEVLPSAEAKFTQYDGDIITDFEGDGVKVTEVYVAENKSGIVCTCTSKSFGGDLTIMVGIDSEGKITGVKVTDHADTPGLGTKDFEADYLKQYNGLDKMNETSVKDDGQINYISGASVSGSAVHYGVFAALKQFETMGGVQ
jgi:electron transport complex protein RnfG